MEIFNVGELEKLNSFENICYARETKGPSVFEWQNFPSDADNFKNVPTYIYCIV